jgi:hypothetical protein
MTEIKLKLITPSTPNYIAIEGVQEYQRHDGYKESPMVAICDLTDAQLEGVANDWKIALLDQARKQRNSRELLKEK